MSIENDIAGKPGINAWAWLEREYGAHMFAFVFLASCSLAMFFGSEDMQSFWGGVISGSMALFIGIYSFFKGRQHYREIVADNDIKTFKDSKFTLKFWEG